jgi:hypothetical protein
LDGMVCVRVIPLSSLNKPIIKSPRELITINKYLIMALK